MQHWDKEIYFGWRKNISGRALFEKIVSDTIDCRKEQVG